MNGIDERSRLLPDAEAQGQYQNGARHPDRRFSHSSSDGEDAENLRHAHGAALRRNSSASLQPEYHQHRSSIKHWHEDADNEVEEQPPKSSMWTVIPVLLLGVFVANADGSLVIASGQHIASEFQQLSQASWIVTSYVLAQAASQPLYGKLSDIFGRKNNLIAAYIFFTIGCLLCGIAREYWILLAGRVISGVGGAGMTAVVSIIIADLVSMRNLAVWRSYVNVAATVGRALGGPLGGWLTDTIGWRWSFFGQCPLTTLGLLLIIWRLPWGTGPAIAPDKDATVLGRVKRVDFAGALSLAVVISASLLVLDFLARGMAWYLTIVPALVALLSGAIFYVVESRWASEPALPIELITKRDALTPYLLAGFQTAAQFAAFYTVPIFFQVAGSTTVSQAGLRLVPAVVGNATGGLLSGLIISKTGRYKLLTVSASLAASTGYFLMLVRWREVVSWYESLYILLGGFGSGVVQSTTFVHLAASLPAEDIAIAGTTLYLAQNLFLLVGIQIATTVLRARVLADLDNSLDGVKGKRKIIQQAISSVDYIRCLPDHIRNLVIQAYIDGLNWTFGLSLGFAVVGLVLGLSLVERRL